MEWSKWSGRKLGEMKRHGTNWDGTILNKVKWNEWNKERWNETKRYEIYWSVVKSNERKKEKKELKWTKWNE